MKRTLRILLSASTATVMEFSALAQNTLPDKTEFQTVESHRVPTVHPNRLSDVVKARDLIGRKVLSLQDEKLGSVENVMVDLASGRVLAVIISSEPAAGGSDTLMAIPPTLLRVAKDHGSLQLDASKDMLSNAPHFSAGHWPDFTQTQYAEDVYRAYRVEPYFSTNVVARARASERKSRDRDERTRTPLDQGNDPADLDTTAQIRKALIAEKNISVRARNATIVTNKGQVTLRGVVKTQEERRLIGEIAIRIALLANVDNQLEVK